MPLGSRLTTVVSTTAINIDFNADGYSVLVDLLIASSWDGTVDLQGTIDGTNYFNLPYVTLGTLTPAWSIAQLTSLSTARYLIPGPVTQIRINCGAGTTGTLTATYRVVPQDSRYVLIKEAVDDGMEAQGNVAHNAVDAGNPLKIGGRARTSVGSAVANNDRVDAWFSDYGEQAVFITDENGNLLGKASSTSADNQAGTTNMLMVASRNVLYNGNTWDRQRGVVETAYLASTPRTATPSTADRTNYNFRGLSILVDVTALADTPSVQITLEIKDTIGNYITIWTAAAAITNVTGTGQYAYLIYPTAENTEGWTETVATVLGSRTYRVLLTHADADSITYSVDVEELV